MSAGGSRSITTGMTSGSDRGGGGGGRSATAHAHHHVEECVAINGRTAPLREGWPCRGVRDMDGVGARESTCSG